MKKYILAAILSVFVCGAAQADTTLEIISTDSEIAASSQDLNTAKELSGRQIDGMKLGLKTDPVQLIGDIQPTEKEKLILSEPKKLTLKGSVPSLAKENKSDKDENKDKNKQGFLSHIGSAILSPIFVPISVAIVGGLVGMTAGAVIHDSLVPVAIGGIIGAVAGLALGLIVTPFFAANDIINGVSELFKGNL